MRALIFCCTFFLILPVLQGNITLYDSQNLTTNFVGMYKEDAVNLLLDAGYNIIKSTYG